MPLLEDLLTRILQQAQNRPDLGEEGKVGTYAGRVVREGDTTQSALARQPQAETETGATAQVAPGLLKDALGMSAMGMMIPRSKQPIKDILGSLHQDRVKSAFTPSSAPTMDAFMQDMLETLGRAVTTEPGIPRGLGVFRRQIAPSDYQFNMGARPLDSDKTLSILDYFQKQGLLQPQILSGQAPGVSTTIDKRILERIKKLMERTQGGLD